MKISINSTWTINETDGIPSGNYRVIFILSSIKKLILFPLSDKNKIKRPINCNISEITDEIEQGNIKEYQFKTPDYQLISDNQLPENHLRKRNERFDSIKEIIKDPSLYLEVTTKRRSKIISNHAKNIAKPIQSIYRYLNLYWMYGQEINALTPAYKKSGAKNSTRQAGESKRGRKAESKSNSFELSTGINISDKDIKKIKKGLNKFYLKTNATVKKAYDDTIAEFYSSEIEKAEINNTYPKTPTYRQYLYWKHKLIDKRVETKKRSSESDYLKNKRALLGSVKDEAEIPGDCFEIDATVADVHIVSPFQRNRVLGRPTIYIVIDKASRMIVGLHVSMEYASWSAARQALVNSFLPKKKYCSQFGIDIEEADWPCAHIPQRLLCDRGEMICENPQKLAVPFMQLDIAPPYRADSKGVVERRFKILNDKVIHSLMGTTRGKHYIRGEDDPRQKAMHTLSEVTEMIIREVIDHNHSLIDELAISTPLLIENDLDFTPLNFWNIHLSKFRHSLKTADEQDIRAKLLPPETASMTRHGILCNDMYYSCDRIVEENWASQARVNGRWKLEARVDQDNSSFIFVRLTESEGFTKCTLLPRSKMLKDLSSADIYYFQDWKKSKEQKNISSTRKINNKRRKTQIETDAKAEQRSLPKDKSKSLKTSDIRARRRQAIIDEKQNNSHIEADVEAYDTPKETKTPNSKEKIILAMLRRKKGDSN
tara:strand:+ start:950 stop:3088 length:2139 start_codon:yes stop_codon:yes gene_type:complete